MLRHRYLPWDQRFLVSHPVSPLAVAQSWEVCRGGGGGELHGDKRSPPPPTSHLATPPRHSQSWNLEVWVQISRTGRGGGRGLGWGLLPYATLAYFLLSLELTGGPEKSFNEKKKKGGGGGALTRAVTPPPKVTLECSDINEPLVTRNRHYGEDVLGFSVFFRVCVGWMGLSGLCQGTPERASL